MSEKTIDELEVMIVGKEANQLMEKMRTASPTSCFDALQRSFYTESDGWNKGLARCELIGSLIEDLEHTRQYNQMIELLNATQDENDVRDRIGSVFGGLCADEKYTSARDLLRAARTAGYDSLPYKGETR